MHSTVPDWVTEIFQCSRTTSNQESSGKKGQLALEDRSIFPQKVKLSCGLHPPHIDMKLCGQGGRCFSSLDAHYCGEEEEIWLNKTHSPQKVETIKAGRHQSLLTSWLLMISTVFFFFWSYGRKMFLCQIICAHPHVFSYWWSPWVSFACSLLGVCLICTASVIKDFVSCPEVFSAFLIRPKLLLIVCCILVIECAALELDCQAAACSGCCTFNQ